MLLQWLAETQPDVVCLQELKAPQGKFPEGPLRDAGYGIVSGVDRHVRGWQKSSDHAPTWIEIAGPPRAGNS